MEHSPIGTEGGKINCCNARLNYFLSHTFSAHTANFCSHCAAKSSNFCFTCGMLQFTMTVCSRKLSSQVHGRELLHFVTSPHPPRPRSMVGLTTNECSSVPSASDLPVWRWSIVQDCQGYLSYPLARTRRPEVQRHSGISVLQAQEQSSTQESTHWLSTPLPLPASHGRGEAKHYGMLEK